MAARPSPSKASIVATIANQLSASATGSPVILGFDAARHRDRGGIDTAVDYVSLGICEETAAGIAVGLWASGRDVVFDAMFVGFLSRCIEPLTIGFDTARYFAGPKVGTLIVRALDAPLALPDVAHEGMVLGTLERVETLNVVHGVDARDVTWALEHLDHAQNALVFLETPEPDAFRDAQTIDAPGPPVRTWRSGAPSAVVCTNNWVAAVQRRFGTTLDVISVPSAADLPGSLSALLETYPSVRSLGVDDTRLQELLRASTTVGALTERDVLRHG